MKAIPSYVPAAQVEFDVTGSYLAGVSTGHSIPALIIQTVVPAMKHAPSFPTAAVRLVAILALVSAPACRTVSVPSAPPSGAIELIPVDPLEKVLQDAARFREVESAAHVARGEHASLQFVVWSEAPISDLRVRVSDIVSVDGDRLPHPATGFVGYVTIGRSTPRPSRDRIVSPSGFYPDPILDVEAIDVSSRSAQPVWVSVPIPDAARPGTYTGRITATGLVSGRPSSSEHEFAVVVYPPRIDQTLWVTNWYTTDAQKLALMNGGEPVEVDTPLYWQLLRALADKMAAYRQNVAIISPIRLTQYRLHDGMFEFDFSRFDRTVETFIDAGVVGLIEGGHIGGRESTWTTPFVVSVPVEEDGEMILERYPISDQRAAGFYRQFIPALVQHLKDRGWYDRYVQHLADEPIEENIDSYVEMAKFIRGLAPDMKFIEATHSRDLDDQVDFWVPQLNFMHEDYEFYRDRQAEGDEIWFYTCLAPQGEYANRFIELPLLKTRILHWINFRFGITGYLHWGLNFWRDDPFGETTGIITESGNVLPGGDAWIVYPARGRVLSSIRLEAMRDGIADYELLRMLAAKDPEAAAEIARQVVYRFDLYDMSVPDFRKKRREILSLLSQE